METPWFPTYSQSGAFGMKKLFNPLDPLRACVRLCLGKGYRLSSPACCGGRSRTQPLLPPCDCTECLFNDLCRGHRACNPPPAGTGLARGLRTGLRPRECSDDLHSALPHEVAHDLQRGPVRLCIHPRRRLDEVGPQQGLVSRHVCSTCCEHHATEAELRDDERAKETRLDGGVDCATPQPLSVPNPPPRVANSDDFAVRRRVPVGAYSVVALADQPSV